MSEPAEILFCHCAHADVVPGPVRREVFEALGAAAGVRAVPDLCGLAARADPLLKRLAEAPSLIIVACFPRAVKWLFAAAGAPLSDDRVEIFNMRAQTAGDILASLPPGPDAALDAERADAAQPAALGAGEWMPWFPVIDRDRCIGCGQCLNFCLFGVYDAPSDGRVEVRNPSRCKTGCPACARICPEAAIIFPKYLAAPINGDEPAETPAGEQGIRVDVSAVLGGDIYAALRQRGGPDQADLQKMLDIPDEVLDSLAGSDAFQAAERRRNHLPGQTDPPE